jgi:hypothetical protein
MKDTMVGRIGRRKKMKLKIKNYAAVGDCAQTFYDTRSTQRFQDFTFIIHIGVGFARLPYLPPE